MQEMTLVYNMSIFQMTFLAYQGNNIGGQAWKDLKSTA